ncbi:hypothetical protein Pcac1_g1973 [Phytophthora cactorum]|nr:hypothetical protein Pcac1_g1973 [Phytophthora cactorum]
MIHDTSTDYEKVTTPNLDPRPSSIVSDTNQKHGDDVDDEEEDSYSKKPLQEKIVWGIIYGTASLAALYFFMVAVKLIGDGFTLALGCDTKGAFDFADNPVAGLMIGTIATALLHSSGTVTSIVVALVGSGGMTIRQGVFGDRARFQRAMAAATVHDMYNLWSVFVLFPLEVLFHPLEELSIAMSNAQTDSGAFSSPVDTIGCTPLVIGANLGTTGTALLAALVTGKSDSVAIALVHFWFNVFGILLFYPIPLTRKPILGWARSLAFSSAAWPMTAVLFLIVLFLVAPGILLGLVYMCTADSTAVEVIGYIVGAIVVVALVGVIFWYTKKGGRTVWHEFLEKKRLEREVQVARDATRSHTQSNLPHNAV